MKMDEMKLDAKLMAFLDELKLQLNGLPEAEKAAALDYYEEHLNDASYDGVSPEEQLAKLDTPANIAASIKAEVSIKNVRRKPDLKNYSKAVKYSRSRITRPLSLFLFSILIFTTYSIAVCLFIITVASVAAACIILSVFVAEAMKIPSQYVPEIISSIGMGVFFAGLMLLTAYGLFKLTGLSVRLSTKLIACMLKKNPTASSPSDFKRFYFTDSHSTDTKHSLDGSANLFLAKEDAADVKAINSTEAEVAGVTEVKAKDSVGARDTQEHGGSTPEKIDLKRLMLKVVMAISAAGLLIALLTGLPVRLFMLYNSVAPSNILLEEWSYSSDDVARISISTTHSNIRLKKGSSDEIEIRYEKADWLEPEINCANGQLEFEERSNGRMPLFRLISLHENSAELTISLPADFKPNDLKLESRGGFIYIDSTEYPVEAKTYTGAIYVDSFADKESAAVKARTSAGFVQAAGEKAGTKTTDGTVYQSHVQSEALIQIETARGNIFID